MRKENLIFFPIIIWILSGIFIFIHNKGGLNVSPWGMHNFVNITIQIAIIFLPITGLLFSIFIKKRMIRYVMIVGCLINIYYLSFPFACAWLDYYKII